MSAIDTVRAMHEDELAFISRKKNEVTVDFPVVQAEIRVECLRQVIAELDKESAANATTPPP